MPRRGGRRKKTRTHIVDDVHAPREKVPQSFIFKRGKVDHAVTELVEDTRKLMLPHTAKNLKERKMNSMKDFASVAGPLGVTHFGIFSQSDSGVVNLRLARLPRGPTLQFRVVKFSRARDVISSQTKPADIQQAYRTPPLIVLNGFQHAINTLQKGGEAAAQIASAASSLKAPVARSEQTDLFAGAGAAVGLRADANKSSSASSSDAPLDPKLLANALTMCQTVFQNMFPSINVSKVKLADCRRIALYHYDKETGTIELRHYSIRALPTGLSKAVKKLVQTRVPDLGALEDVSEYLTGEGAGAAATGVMSDSEYEDDGANEVTLPQNYAGRGNKRASQSAIRLSEIGPRMTLQLIKIEEGMVGGEVLYHALVRKTAEEVVAMREAHENARALKAARRAEQAKNVARKQAETEEKRRLKAERRAAKAQALAEISEDEDGQADIEESSDDELMEDQQDTNEDVDEDIVDDESDQIADLDDSEDVSDDDDVSDEDTAAVVQEEQESEEIEVRSAENKRTHTKKSNGQTNSKRRRQNK